MKKLIWVLGFLTVVAIGYFGYVIISDFYDVAEEYEEDKAADNEIQTEDSKTAMADTVEVKDNNGEDLNPFGSGVQMEDLTDTNYQNYIHLMSHQKVEAGEKRGFYEMTKERIQWLLDGLKVADLKRRDVYLDILERWASDDFTQADHDHNTIWEMQNGEVGRATGILSSDEEQAYIESQK